MEPPDLSEEALLPGWDVMATLEDATVPLVSAAASSISDIEHLTIEFTMNMFFVSHHGLPYCQGSLTICSQSYLKLYFV